MDFDFISYKQLSDLVFYGKMIDLKSYIVITTLQRKKQNKTCFCFCLFAFSRAVSATYGVSQARGLIRAVAAGLCQSHSNTRSRAASVTYTTAHGNTGSSTH